MLKDDFCGQPSWWFQPFWDGLPLGEGFEDQRFEYRGPDIKPSCNSSLQMLYYFDEDFCVVDLNKDLSSDPNLEYAREIKFKIALGQIIKVGKPQCFD